MVRPMAQEEGSAWLRENSYCSERCEEGHFQVWECGLAGPDCFREAGHLLEAGSGPGKPRGTATMEKAGETKGQCAKKQSVWSTGQQSYCKSSLRKGTTSERLKLGVHIISCHLFTFPLQVCANKPALGVLLATVQSNSEPLCMVRDEIFLNVD